MMFYTQKLLSKSLLDLKISVIIVKYLELIRLCIHKANPEDIFKLTFYLLQNTYQLPSLLFMFVYYSLKWMKWHYLHGVILKVKGHKK